MFFTYAFSLSNGVKLFRCRYNTELQEKSKHERDRALADGEARLKLFESAVKSREEAVASRRGGDARRPRLTHGGTGARFERNM